MSDTAADTPGSAATSAPAGTSGDIAAAARARLAAWRATRAVAAAATSPTAKAVGRGAAAAAKRAAVAATTPRTSTARTSAGHQPVGQLYATGRPWLTAPRVAACIVGIIGVAATKANLEIMGAGAGVGALILAIGIQAVLTIGQRAMWRDRNVNLVGLVSTAFDIFFNFGSVWPFVSRLDDTPSWKAAMAASDMALNTRAPNFTEAIAGVIVSAAIAAAFEWLWYLED
jgi:hypothetical protein